MTIREVRMDKPLLRLAVALSVFVVWFVTAEGQQPVQSPRYVHDEVLVRFRPDTPQGRRDAIVAAAGARVLRRLNEVNVDRVRLARGTRGDAAIAALLQNPDVVSAEQTYIRQIV